ncbi:hypothetical protein HN51_060202 [Arachis hypogaea]|uniref:GDSL esterase/lipase 7-like n=1 Tax=Arachis ipaensis TaxID=130454 RepID=UPI000A2B6D59|nr:GDSL esterase/lipase 7-like [Arachis ipaensis]XP_025680405.1 GDSL esterase/lipase 7 [Arachis hypogaea]QHN83786.1 GDSL esterase/lipase [Arachis hypogaea]
MEKMMKSNTMFALLFVLISNLFATIYCTQPLAPALYVFGDSLVDNGNNNWIPDVAKSNYYPYGSNFFAGPTGRFSNGRNLVDFLAEYMGLPYPPPYLSKEGPSSLTGINYASGAAGIVECTGSQAGMVVPLDEQLANFQMTITRDLPIYMSQSEISEHVSKAIYLLSIGNNDYLINYLGAFTGVSATSTVYAPEPFAELLINTLEKQLQQLYKLGARKIILNDLCPLGCIPMYLNTRPHKGACVDEINALVQHFNKRLPSMLQRLSSTLTGAVFVKGNIYATATEIILNPTKYGFSDVRSQCCETSFNLMCMPLKTPCSDPEAKFFWDGAHPTEATYSIIAKRMISDKSVLTPFTLQELLQL